MKIFSLKLISTFMLLTMAQPVLAHTQWLRPNVFNTALHGNNLWLSSQLSLSEAAFTPERALVAKQISVTTPDGQQQLITDAFTGHTATVFDYQVEQGGTYKVEVMVGPQIRQRKKSSKPNAKPPTKSRTVSRLTAYVTADAPNTTALQPANVWLEIIPVTHPADLVAQEAAKFKVLYHGKAFANQVLTLVPSGSEYSNTNLNQQYTTDAQGAVEITLANAGVYLLKARHKEVLTNDPQADQLIVSAALTFEAQVN